MNEKEFSEKLKPWLERSARTLGEMQETRLKAARLRALDAYREPVRLFGLVPMAAGTAQRICSSSRQNNRRRPSEDIWTGRRGLTPGIV